VQQRWQALTERSKSGASVVIIPEHLSSRGGTLRPAGVDRLA
jgi:hypothetical protein